MSTAATLAHDLERVEELLAEALASPVPLLAEAGRHIVGSGGKRLRPIVLLWAFRAAGGGEPTLAQRLAAAIELLHTASLIHDDINDRSSLRRGHATVNARWGDTLALLAGDYVFVQVLQMIAALAPEAMQIVARASRALVEGETLQFLARWRADIHEDGYFRIVGLKTGALFAACGELGAWAAGADAETMAALSAYGRQLGLAFQIRDDALDLVGEPETMGKPLGNDLSGGELNLCVVHALQHSSAAAEAWSRHDPLPVQQAIARLGAVGYALARAQAFVAQAVAAVQSLPPSDARQALCELAERAIARQA